MSVTYEASVIVGVKLTRKTFDAQVIRYNEKTGKPYQTTERQSSLFYADGRKVEFDPDDVYELDGEDDSLEWFADDDDDMGGIIGRVVVSVNQHTDYAVAIPPDAEIQIIKDRVGWLLQKMRCLETPQLQLVMICC